MGKALDIHAIKKILPHREPMLLIDEAELQDGVSIARYTVRGDEFFLQGHFPGQAIVPGVILCEMMGQSACLLIDGQTEEGFTPYFTGLNKVKFRKKVLPGDTLVFKSERTGQKDNFYFIKSAGYVQDTLCVSGELSFYIEAGGQEGA